MNYVEADCNYSKSELKLLIEDAIDWAHSTGLIIRTTEHKDRSDVCQIAPFTLFPSPFPRRLFQQALDVHQSMQLLYFKISWDYPFLVDAHKDVIKSDLFTQKMVNILEKIHAEGIKQKLTLLTQRADYMCHYTGECHAKESGDGKFQLKQIEVNNISVSMGGLAMRATNLHRRMLNKIGKQVSREQVPDNDPISTLADGLYTAWKLFGDKNALTLVVIGDVNQNQFDQRYVEYGLEAASRGQMCIRRLTLTECVNSLTIDANSTLMFNGKTIGVVYFRAGYSPDDYPSEKEWTARLMIERSTAIKCPWIGLQLANTKKIQQVLSCDGVLKRFFPKTGDDQVLKLVKETFAQMWGLEKDDETTRIVIQDVISNPHKYVLKPQLEGGGGNYFDQEIVDKLQAFSAEQRASHILMQKITPLVIKNYLIKAKALEARDNSSPNEPKLINVVSELGIYGCLIGDGNTMTVECNKVGGHILRTKPEHVNEGGVAIGAAVIDTPYLF